MTDMPFRKDLSALAEHHGVQVPQPTPRTGPAPAKSGRRLPPAIREAAATALKAYRESSEYAKLKADLPTLGLADLQIRFQNALEGPHFAPLLATLRGPEMLSEDPEDFMPQAVSLGLMAEAVLIVGVGGSVGYVMDLSISDPKSGIYAGGAFDAGIDAGLEGDVCLGFWREGVDDLSGLYVGEEVDVDEGVGVTEATFLHDDELALAFVGFDLGIGDGMENTDYYFFEFDVGRAPIYQPGDATYLVQLGVITCDNSKDDYDTVYFEFLQDNDSTVYRYPAWDGYQMCESQNNSQYYQWRVGLIAKFNSSLKLRLHVGDYTFDDVTVTASNFSGLNGAYTINWDTTHGMMDEIKYAMDINLIRN